MRPPSVGRWGQEETFVNDKTIEIIVLHRSFVPNSVRWILSRKYRKRHDWFRDVNGSRRKTWRDTVCRPFPYRTPLQCLIILLSTAKSDSQFVMGVNDLPTLYLELITRRSRNNNTISSTNNELGTHPCEIYYTSWNVTRKKNSSTRYE